MVINYCFFPFFYNILLYTGQNYKKQSEIQRNSFLFLPKQISFLVHSYLLSRSHIEKPVVPISKTIYPNIENQKSQQLEQMVFDIETNGFCI